MDEVLFTRVLDVLGGYYKPEDVGFDFITYQIFSAKPTVNHFMVIAEDCITRQIYLLYGNIDIYGTNLHLCKAVRKIDKTKPFIFKYENIWGCCNGTRNTAAVYGHSPEYVYKTWMEMNNATQ